MARVPPEVTGLAMAGRTIIPIRNRRGLVTCYWSAFERPAYQCFTGERVWEIVSPRAQAYLMTMFDDPRIHRMICRAPELDDELASYAIQA